MKIVLLDGVEKHHKNVDEIVDFFKNYSQDKHLDLNIIPLREKRISHCTECRVCTSKEGQDPVKCFLEDGMDEVIDTIESADAYVIIADRPSVFKRNKIFKKFSKRLVAYYYRPNKDEPARRRKPELSKNAIIINYNLASYLKDYSYELAQKHLRKSAKSIGANVIDSLMVIPSKNEQNMYLNMSCN
jgi:hypothetical protein